MASEDGDTAQRDPTIYAQVPVPEGHTCQRYIPGDDGMEACENEADVVFVYEKSLREDDDRRGNCLACWGCAPLADEGKLATDGGTTRSDADDTDTDADTESDGPTCGTCGLDHGFMDAGVRVTRGSASPICPRCGLQYPFPPSDRDAFAAVYERGAVDYPQHRLDETEVRRRLPAVDTISDPDVRSEVIRLSASAPAYFWIKPASTSEYHHPICRESRGLWAHTLMVAAVAERLAESYAERGLADADHAIAAALLHDQRKCGPHAAPEDSSTSDHDVTMAQVIREESTLPEPVAQAVSTHMGPWYDGPWPATPLAQLVHNADMAASTPRVTPHVHGPAPEELADIGVTEGAE